MTTHSSVLAWRIPGTGEPGGLPSMGSHRVRYDWSYLAAVAAARRFFFSFFFYARRYLIATLMGWIVPLAPIYMLKSYPKQVSQNVTLFGEGLY